ncbi:MAG TPA: hypothetical protein VFR23_04660 [Jiangellaceae bacterium]|nr:hypothetical protein [Jiangellaceae bacterium]
MGLDITAYSRLKHIGRHTEDWCEDYENHVMAFAYDDFPLSFRGIPVLGTTQHGAVTFLDAGCFEITEETERHAFRAGSYSGYNRWRADLQRQFNHATEPDRPFYELIWFADNEGSIGPDAAKDLLADFREHAAAYDPGEYADYFREKYQDWTRACELAADSGLIRFH